MQLGLQKYTLPLTTDELAKTVQEEVRFEVLMATSMKMAVFWDVAPYTLVSDG
jgi:hypothetical protein